MPTLAVMFALLAGVAAATWTLCLKLGATKINVALGALVVTSAAFVANATTLLIMRARGHAIVFQWEALRISSSLIVGGTSTALVLLIGFLALQEPVTFTRLLALGLIVCGMLLLQSQGG